MQFVMFEKCREFLSLHSVTLNPIGFIFQNVGSGAFTTAKVNKIWGYQPRHFLKTLNCSGIFYHHRVVMCQSVLNE
jgi:hypothetical protein